VSVIPLDTDEGLAKVMSDLSVKEMELSTITNKLKFSSTKTTELEEQARVERYSWDK
jgi:hypothetical protein